MFGVLTEKFQNLFSKLSSSSKLTEENIADAVRQVRIALLEADVNYTVASSFMKKVKERAIGESLIRSVKPSQQFIKIVHDELKLLMGENEPDFKLKPTFTTIMLCGLQGSGKTTQCAKLALFFTKKEKKKKILLAACDLQRPAAVEQLKKLADQISIDVFSIPGEKDPRIVAKKAHLKARQEAYDILIVDTAGRLHIDEPLMKELLQIKEIVVPDEVLFVANATTGQDAVKTALEFDSKVSITGSILTMLDGDARAGAAISIREVTKKPLLFEGVGEKLSDLQLFNPKSMADRILGMGDVINLVRKASDVMDEKESEQMEKKLRKASFHFDDYLKQMKMMKKMGSMKNIMSMVPGFSNLKQPEGSEKEFKKTEAMILSMTIRERKELDDLNFSRRRRIAKGSGTKIDDVNRMVKGFKRMKQFFKKMPQMKKGMFGGGFSQMKQQMEDMKWH